MKKKIVLAGVAMLMMAGCSSGGEQESNWQSRWQYAWDHQMTAEGRVAVCSAWDVTPTAAALQVENAMRLPAGTGLGKQMLRQVC